VIGKLSSESQLQQFGAQKVADNLTKLVCSGQLRLAASTTGPFDARNYDAELMQGFSTSIARANSFIYAYTKQINSVEPKPVEKSNR
jgi:hypothetical protein